MKKKKIGCNTRMFQAVNQIEIDCMILIMHIQAVAYKKIDLNVEKIRL